MTDRDIENRKEACRTYLEQTKLLVALASAFLLAPAALWALVGPGPERVLTSTQLLAVLATEAALIVSVFSGYVVFGAVAGSQHGGTYDVFRPGTRIASAFQIAALLLAMVSFSCLLISAMRREANPSTQPRVGPSPRAPLQTR